MKASELRELTVDELRQKEKELQSEFFNLRFQLVTNQLTNTAKKSLVKQDIARVKTVLREKTK